MTSPIVRDRDPRLPVAMTSLALEKLIRDAAEALGEGRSSPAVVQSPWLHEQMHGRVAYPSAYGELLDAELSPADAARRLKATGWVRIPGATQRRLGVTAVLFEHAARVRLRLWIVGAAARQATPLREALASSRIHEGAPNYRIPNEPERDAMLNWLAEWPAEPGPARSGRSAGGRIGERRHVFRGLDLAVEPGVFTPYAISEQIVDRALFLTRDRREPTLVDVGTGTGAIALAYASERPDARVYAIDISADSVALCDANRKELGLGNVTPLAGSLLEPVAELGPVDVVCANMPYVPRDLAILSELAGPPGTVLGSGVDGLDLVRDLAAQACPLLAHPGFLIVQIIAGQVSALSEHLQMLGYSVADTAAESATASHGAVVLSASWSGESR